MLCFMPNRSIVNTNNFYLKSDFLHIILYCLLVIALTLNKSSNIILVSTLSVSDLTDFPKNSCNLSHKILGSTSIK